MPTIEEFQQMEIRLPHTKSPRPDKVHIGLVQLSTDHTLETDWTRLTRDSALVFSSRVYYSSVMTPEALKAIADGITKSAGLIAVGLPMDVMAFGCTSASMLIGSDTIAQLLTENHPGLPATDPWAASKAAFRYLGAQRVSIFSPYPTEVNYPLYTQLVKEGFTVPAISALCIQNDTDITSVSYDTMKKGVEQILHQAKTDLVFMSCTNLRVLDHIEKLESFFNIPVVCSNQAMFWHAMTLAGKKPGCMGYGQLLNL